MNPKHTFEAFVVGPSNQFAYAAAKRICEDPGSIYNPLFIYGEVGLGKTHLINAIGNEIADKYPGKVIYSLSAEQFMNELIFSIHHDEFSEFKAKYMSADVLLMDDIQYLVDKRYTHEQFFYTFNSLYERQRQIVISSDRAPINISKIGKRLRSRFGMGLVSKIQLPEIETKVAILLKKAATGNIVMRDEVAYFIASKIKSDIRELEGCLIKLGAYSALTGCPIDINMAECILKDLIPEGAKSLTVDRIRKVINSFWTKLRHYH